MWHQHVFLVSANLPSTSFPPHPHHIFVWTLPQSAFPLCIHTVCVTDSLLPLRSLPSQWPLSGSPVYIDNLNVQIKNSKLWSTYERDHVAFSFLGPCFLTHHNIFWFHMFSCKFHFSSHTDTIPLCICTHFNYLLLSWWTFRLPPFPSSCEWSSNEYGGTRVPAAERRVLGAHADVWYN